MIQDLMSAQAQAQKATVSQWCRVLGLSPIHISEPTRQEAISYAVFCAQKK